MNRLAFSNLLLACVLFSPFAHAGSFSCPASLPSSAPGFEQIGPSPSAPSRLSGLRLYDGPPGEEQKPSPVQLAPGETAGRTKHLTAKWRLGGDEHLLMVCDYGGTQAYYRAAVPFSAQQCVLRRQVGHTTASCQ